MEDLGHNTPRSIKNNVESLINLEQIEGSKDGNHACHTTQIWILYRKELSTSGLNECNLAHKLR